MRYIFYEGKKMKKTIFSIALLGYSTMLMASYKTISIAGTADLQGMMEASIQKFDLNGDGIKEEVSMGGIANLATVYAKLKKENPNTVVVSVGDDLMNKFFHIYKGKAILSLVSDAGYDYYVFGNHEFDKGSKVLSSALDDVKFHVLCSDLDVSVSALKGKCIPYEIKEMDGVKVGFFSLMTEDLPLVTSERDVKILADNVTTAKKMIKVLKKKGANIIVALSHIGYKQDVALAKQVKGIDLIFGGHSHEYVKKMGHIGKTAIVNGGEQGVQVIKVDIPLDKHLKVLSKEVHMIKVPVPNTSKADAAILAKVKAYKKNFPKAVILGTTKASWNLSSDEIRKHESSVANLINDLMKEKFQVDIVLNNAGAFRGKKIYKPGNITDEMLKSIDEFSNYAYIFKLKGKHLKEILERSAASYGEGGLMHTSGLRYAIYLPGEVQKIEGSKIVKKGSRVTEIKIQKGENWVDIETEKAYSILSNSFIVNDEGDGYFWFKKYGTDMKNTYATFYSIMAEFIERHKVLSPKAKDNRLNIIY
jgi:5'-nucleotidase